MTDTPNSQAFSFVNSPAFSSFQQRNKDAKSLKRPRLPDKSPASMCEEELLQAFTMPADDQTNTKTKPAKLTPESFAMPIANFRPSVPANLNSENTFEAGSFLGESPVPKRSYPVVSIPPATETYQPPSKLGPPVQYQCSVCSSPYTALDDLTLHILRMHCVGVLECPYCPATSQDFSALSIHVEFTHKGDRPLNIGNPDCTWCQSQIKHQNYCLVKKNTKRKP